MGRFTLRVYRKTDIRANWQRNKLHMGKQSVVIGQDINTTYCGFVILGRQDSDRSSALQ